MKLSDASPTRSWLYAFGICAVVVIACMAWVDRPVADFVDDHLSWRDFAQVTMHILWPRVLIPVVALLWLGGALAWRSGGRPMEAWNRATLLSVASVVVTLIAVVILKRIFGRSDPVPLWVHRRVYTFRLLRGAQRYMAFPSGTTAVSAALLSVFAILLPPMRLTCALLLILVAIALIITNSHWVADCIGGAFLGAFLGWAVVRRYGHAH